MNQVYRLVWRAACGAFVAVAESATGHGKAGAALVCAVAAVASLAHAAGVNPMVVDGQAAIAVNGSTTTVTQSSSAVRINWESLGLAAGEVLRFVQPSSQSVALNMVTGSAKTEIFGSILANGQVYLLNPSGVVFRPGSEVSVGSLVAGTFGVSSFNLATGEVVLSRNGSTGETVNEGTLRVGENGQVVLVGATVRNEEGARIETGGGSRSGIFMLSGDRVEFKRAESSPLSYQIVASGGVATVANNGDLVSRGGQIHLDARSAMGGVVNTTGIIEAGTAESNTSGHVRLIAGGAGGSVSVYGGHINTGNNGSQRAVLDAGGKLHVELLSHGDMSTSYYAPSKLTAAELVSGVNKTYDGTKDASLAFDLTKLGGESAFRWAVDSSVFGLAGAGDNKAVRYTVTQQLGEVSSVKFSGTTRANIDKRVISLLVEDKAYDGTTVTTVTIDKSDILPGDSGVKVSPLPGASSQFVSANAGDSVAVVSGLQLAGTGAENYTLGSAYGTIRPALLTVTARDDSKTYDGNAYSGGNGVVFGPFVNGETAEVLGGSISYKVGANGAVDAGTYTISVSGLTSRNYLLNYVDGTLTVGKAALTVKVNDATATYNGQAYAGGTVSYDGFVGTDSATKTGVLGGNLLFTYGDGVVPVNAGTYSARASGLTSTNYALSYENGTLVINPAALTIRANDLTKVQDNVPFTGGNGVTPIGLAPTDTLASLSGALVYGGTSQGAVLPSTTTILASGLSSSNYNITYEPGQLTILPTAIIPPESTPPTGIDPLAGLAPTAAGEQEDDKKIRTRVRKDNSPIRDEDGGVRLPPALQ